MESILGESLLLTVTPHFLIHFRHINVHGLYSYAPDYTLNNLAGSIILYVAIRVHTCIMSTIQHIPIKIIIQVSYRSRSAQKLIKLANNSLHNSYTLAVYYTLSVIAQLNCYIRNNNFSKNLYMDHDSYCDNRRCIQW